MGNGKYVKGKDGKFKGSIGDGRDNVPKADDTPSVSLPDNTPTEEPASPIASAFDRYQPKVPVLKYRTVDGVTSVFLNGQSEADYEAVADRKLEDDMSVQPGSQLLPLAERPNLSRRVQWSLAASKEPMVARYLAANPTAEPEVLSAMVDPFNHYAEPTEDEASLMWLVANNPNTRPGTLAHLSHVVGADATSTRSTVGAIAEIREQVARHPSTPGHIRDDLAKDPSVKVRLAVASSGHASTETLRHLAHDEDYYVRVEAESRLANK